MRRILLVMSVALVMAAVLVASAMPAFAAKPPANKNQYTCNKYTYDPVTGETSTDTVLNVPKGQVANYEGYYCFKGDDIVAP